MPQQGAPGRAESNGAAAGSVVPCDKRSAQTMMLGYERVRPHKHAPCGKTAAHGRWWDAWAHWHFTPCTRPPLASQAIHPLVDIRPTLCCPRTSGSRSSWGTWERGTTTTSSWPSRTCSYGLFRYLTCVTTTDVGVDSQTAEHPSGYTTMRTLRVPLAAADLKQIKNRQAGVAAHTASGLQRSVS